MKLKLLYEDGHWQLLPSKRSRKDYSKLVNPKDRNKFIKWGKRPYKDPHLDKVKEIF